MRCLRRERGQATSEYVGLLLVVTAAIAAVSASGIAEAVTAKVGEAIAAIASDEGLGESQGGKAGARRQPAQGPSAAAQPADYRPHLSEARQAAGRGSGGMAIVPTMTPASDGSAARVPASAVRSGQVVGAPPLVQGRIQLVREIARGLGRGWRWLRGSPQKPPPAKPAPKPGTPLQLGQPGAAAGTREVLKQSEDSARGLAKELQASVASKIARERFVTIAVAVGRDAQGKLRTVTATSGKSPTLPQGAREAATKRGLEVATTRGTMHGEERVLAFMSERGIRPITVGAGRGICPERCVGAIARAGSTRASPVRSAQRRSAR